MKKHPKTTSSLADYTGILAAFVCLLHCLAGPIVMGATVGAHGHDHSADGPWYLHRAWDFVFLGIGFLAVAYSARHTPRPWMKRLLWASFASLTAAILFETYGQVFRLLVYLFSVVLIGAHLYNLRNLWRRRPKQDQEYALHQPLNQPEILTSANSWRV